MNAGAGPFTHTVLLRVPDGSDAGVLGEVVEGLEALRDEDTHHVGVSIRRDLGLRPGNPRTFDVSFEARFDDTDSFWSYLDGAPHRRFIEEIAMPRGLTIASIQVAD